MYLFLFVSFIYFIACMFKIVNPKELIDKIDPSGNIKIEKSEIVETTSDTEIETSNRKRKLFDDTMKEPSGKTIIPYKRVRSGSF